MTDFDRAKLINDAVDIEAEVMADQIYKIVTSQACSTVSVNAALRAMASIVAIVCCGPKDMAVSFQAHGIFEECLSEQLKLYRNEITKCANAD